MVIFGISILVQLVSGRPLHPPPHDPLKPTFLCIFCALSDETYCHCQKLDLKGEKFKMAVIQNAVFYEMYIS